MGKDNFCSFYTNSEEITSLMVNNLQVNDGFRILEPSAGEGVFIDSLLSQNQNLFVDAIDINKDVISLLKEKYSNNKNINIICTDTLLDDKLDKIAFCGGMYDAIIGNPPYGAWQEYEKRATLKKKYAGHYVKETYSLFLLRCLSLLKLNGKLSFIVPDTFLYLNLHTKLRKTLLINSKISQIIIFPSKFFPGISFGYSNLCIITLQKEKPEISKNNIVTILKDLKTVSDLNEIKNNNILPHITKYNLKQDEILNNKDCRFILADNNIISLLNKSKKCIGDFADVVTGFYSGNNKKYVKVASQDVRGAKGYNIINHDEIGNSNSLEGIDSDKDIYIPYIKSASTTKYIRKDNDWYLLWNKKAIKEYSSNPKARFQNSKFYFRDGIAIPMVKSSNIKATIMHNCIFDQSIVGIFPHNSSLMNYFLALFNSEYFNKMIHIINPTANNSANYIKQIPLVLPNEHDLNEINAMVTKILFQKNSKSAIDLIHEQLNQKILDIYAKA